MMLVEDFRTDGISDIRCLDHSVLPFIAYLLSQRGLQVTADDMSGIIVIGGEGNQGKFGGSSSLIAYSWHCYIANKTC